MLDGIRAASRFLKSIGLERYEISNYAVPGFECRHNLAVWRGEDYIGIGDGAYGRIGLARTRNWWGQSPSFFPSNAPKTRGLSPKTRGLSPTIETVSEENDEKERTIFRLRTTEGLNASRHPEWIPILERFVSEGLLVRGGCAAPNVYRLTDRGTEVCDAILAEIV